MNIRIISNVAYSSKVLLEGEIHDIPDDAAESFIARKVAEAVEAQDKPVQTESEVEEAARQAGQVPAQEVPAQKPIAPVQKKGRR